MGHKSRSRHDNHLLVSHLYGYSEISLKNPLCKKRNKNFQGSYLDKSQESAGLMIGVPPPFALKATQVQDFLQEFTSRANMRKRIQNLKECMSMRENLSLVAINHTNIQEWLL